MENRKRERDEDAKDDAAERRLKRVRAFFRAYGDVDASSMAVDAARFEPSEGRLMAPPLWHEHHPVFNADTAEFLALRQQLKELPRHHQRLRINDDLEMFITNTVHSTELINVETRQPYRLPLNHLMLNFMFMASQSNMPRFAKIVQRYGPTRRVTQLIFTTGRMVDTGSEPFEVKRVLANMLVSMMRTSGLKNIGIGRRVCQNIVTTGMLSFPVRLWVLKARYGDRVEYDPTEFPGATIRDPSLVTEVAVDDGSPEALELKAALTALYDPNVPFQTIDSHEDERFDENDEDEARRQATAFAHAYVERITPTTGEDIMRRAAQGDPEAIEAMLNHLVAEQTARIKKKKNMVGLLFGNGCFIVGGPKNKSESLRATSTLYEMFDHCRDTPENRLLEEAYLKKHGIVVPPSASATTPTSSSLPAAAGAAAGVAATGKKPRGRPPGSGRGPRGPAAARSGAKKPRKTAAVTAPPPPVSKSTIII
jgi:TATA-box binding protein (TBP) (component of TFIID and TFIIIB)